MVQVERRSILIAVLLLSTLFPATAQTQTADELLEIAERVIFPQIYRAKMRIETVKPGERGSVLEMLSEYKEGSGSFIEMTAPARSRGLRFLEKEESLYMFNPRSNSRRPLRLSGEQSFQGTVFSNNDVSDPQYTDDYRARITGEERLDHPDFGLVDCYLLEAEAKRPEAPYGRIKMWIEKEELKPLRFDYFAKSGLLFKRMILKDFNQLAGDLRPRVMRMESFEIEGAYSEVIIEEMEALDDLPDSRFSTQSLLR